MSAYAPLTPDWPLVSAAPSPYAYKLDGGLGMAAPSGGVLALDEANRTADFVISTGSTDRTGDEMVLDGVDLSEYARNPVVLFGHRQGTPQSVEASKPVGTCVSPDGHLAIWRDKGRLIARCHFHEDTEEAREVWLGVKNGWLRGASIGFDPIGDPVPLGTANGKRMGYRFERWKLLEWSIVVIPMNADCVRIRSYLADAPALTPAFRKALEYAAKSEFREGDHPRADDGRFGDKPGAHGGKEAPKEAAVDHAGYLARARKEPGRALNFYTSDLAVGLREGEAAPADVKKPLGEVLRAARDAVDDHYTDVANEAEARWQARYGRVIVRALGKNEIAEQSERLASDLAEYADDFHDAAHAVEHALDRLTAHAGKRGKVSEKAADALEQAGLDADEAYDDYLAAVKERVASYDSDLAYAARQQWEEDAAGHAARLNEEDYQDDPEGRASDLASFNEDLAADGSPFRLGYDEAAGEVVWHEIEAPEKSALVALRPLPALLTKALGSLSDGLKTGRLTMTEKAFPPKKGEDEGGKERPDDNDQQQSPPEQGAGKRASGAPDLATVIASLTAAIVQLQDMVQPKEAPAPEQAAPPPDDAGGMGDDLDREPDVEGKRDVTDPRNEESQDEDARNAMDRYRRGARPARTKATKGYLRKEHHTALGEAADHLDEMGQLPRESKWGAGMGAACKYHAANIRKALEESSGTQGGSAVPEEPQMDESTMKALSQAVEGATAGVRERLFRLTGKRL